jgi:hypothetical protein
MITISGLEGMTVEQILVEVREGARFVHFQCCFSVISSMMKPAG